MKALLKRQATVEGAASSFARTGKMLKASFVRRPVDLETAREVRRRAEIEQRATAVAEDKCRALEQSDVELQEKLAVLDFLRIQRLKHQAALAAMKAAARQDRSLRWKIFTLRLRLVSALTVGICALIAGIAVGGVISPPAWLTPPQPVAENEREPSFAYEDGVGVTPKLKFERELTAH